MSAPQQNAASAAQDEAGNVAHAAADQAAGVAGSAASAATDVAGTAKQQAANVIGESVDQAKDLLGTVRDQVAEQAGTQQERITGGLRNVSTQLRDGDTSGVVGQVMSEASQRLEALAGHLERSGPQGVVQDLRGYAKRNPGSFLLGAALAGLVSGRVAKGLKADGKPTPQPVSGSAAGRPGSGTARTSPQVGGIPPAGTGVQAGYLATPDPRSSSQPGPAGPGSPASAYPAPDGPAPIHYEDPTRTETPGGLR